MLLEKIEKCQSDCRPTRSSQAQLPKEKTVFFAFRVFSLLIATLVFSCFRPTLAAEAELAKTQFRGPIDLAVTTDSKWAVTANQLSNTLSLVDIEQRRVVDEIACGQNPVALLRLSNTEFAISCSDSGSVELYSIAGGSLARIRSINVGYLPHGLAADPHNPQRAYVGLVATGEVAEIDFEQATVVRRFEVGKWPRYLTLSPDGKRLAVGLAGDSCVAVVDVAKGEVLYEEPLSGGINLGHMQCSKDGQYVYFPWMIYRTNPIDVRNIRLGWVLASRVARVRLDGPAYREAISLDVPRLAVSDPFGISLTPSEHRMAVTSSGTAELLVYRLKDLPFIGAGGPGDLIDDKLLRDRDLFYRIDLGGRPLSVRALPDDQSVVVCNHTLDILQIINLESREVTAEIPLGRIPEETLVHRGMKIFYDGKRSLDQWYSCHSCHLDGGSNAKAMDTWNDGTPLTTKTVLPLQGVVDTAPWTWHGWQQDLDESIQNSFTSTMQGREVSSEDLAAIRAYLASLQLPQNPFRHADGKLSEAAERGQRVFESSTAACNQCHNGPRFSDGKVHDVGLGSENDKYKGYNTPSLIGAYRKVRFLHDGRAKTLESVLTKYHSPSKVSGTTDLSESEVADLVEYLKSL